MSNASTKDSAATEGCAAVTGYAPTWEYHTERDLNYIKDMLLKRLGSQGWEMCGCHVTRETEVVCYFKRLSSHTAERSGPRTQDAATATDHL